ncbi:MAG: pilus assembly protein PilM [Clostridia bacterium]|nr:pilus assembly protein PilM [Clostridia bacterium]
MPLNANKAEKQKKPKKVIKLESPKAEEKVLAVGVDPEELIFALDIGTRTVVGILGIPEKDKLKVIATHVQEHKNRAMLDGQIHDIGQVAEIAKEVKDSIEKKTGFKLSKVAIAAAGRVLKTCEVKVEREIEQGREIDQELIGSLEMEGIQKAQLKLDEEINKEDKTQFYCVGYSVINYYLNSYVISTLLGHKGRKIGADILATFLPHIVVDSLYTVMSKIGLEIVSLTLEPIAAINVTIPKDLRLLNLALVDIGAGTSDIAITKDGSVVAYGMAPIAGDEITEKIAQHYLVDFNTGEQIKISLTGKKDTVSFVDILGKKHAVAIAEIVEVIGPTVSHLAETISQKILEYNHRAPNAVFLIGGGSQIPGLTEMIAEQLKLSKDRVVVRGRDIIQNIKFTGKQLTGPEAITPFGIAVTAQMQKGQDFMAVTINGKKIRLFNSKRLTVADALILIGFNPNQLIGRSGKSIQFELNGVKKIVRGGYGKAAEIFVNEKNANLETVLKVGDNIRVNPAEDGENAAIKVIDLIGEARTGKIVFNGTVMDMDTKIYINGKIATPQNDILDGDNVQVTEIKILLDLIKHYEINIENYTVTVNGQEVGFDYVLKNSDEIQCKKKVDKIDEGEAALEDASEEKTFPGEVIVIEEGNNLENSNPDDIQRETVVIQQEALGPDFSSMRVVVNGNPISIASEKKQFIFVDVFNYIDFDLSNPKGNVVLKLNGEKAGFTDVIKPGDIIDIYWER